MSNKHHILIVDDEPDIRDLLAITLDRMGLNTSCAEDLTSAKALLAKEQFDLCLTDLKLPDGNGINLLEHIQKTASDLPVAVITAYGSMDTAIEALKAGAFDFISKPVELDRLRKLIDTALSLLKTPNSYSGTEKLLGQSNIIAKLRQKILKLSRSQAPVFINGESGSGKELVARLIHENSPRAEKPFIAVNCGAIPGELVESEFFGHKKGSFTGANDNKKGLFQAADGGTLFLDEVADLPLDMQVKLLRAIQEKTVRAVGATLEEKVDIRILSATHKNLLEEIEANRFRSDLYYRINVIELNVPALRQRREDIPLLAENILRNLSSGSHPITLSLSALHKLQSYNFPGNVRELQNILERAYTLAESKQINIEDLALNDENIEENPDIAVTTEADGTILDLVSEAPAVTLDEEPHLQQQTDFDPRQAYGKLDDYLGEIEKQILISAINDSNGNKTAAARLLGISFRMLRYRLKKFGMN